MATNPRAGGAEFEGASDLTDEPMSDKPPASAGSHDRLKLKVLIQSLNYAPELTGIGKYTGEMAAWLAARGHDVHVIAGLLHFLVIELTQELCERAAAHAEVFALRAYAGVQLAGADLLRERAGAEVSFACFDRRLSQAARVLGLQVRGG